MNDQKGDARYTQCQAWRRPAALAVAAVLAVVGLMFWPGAASEGESHASAAGEATAFMGSWNTGVASLNEDSWALGGPSPLLDIVLEGESRIGLISARDSAGSLRSATVRWHAVDDFSEVLTWMDTPGPARGPRPCAVRLSGDGTITASNGDRVFFEAVSGSACAADSRDRIRGLWSITGGTGDFAGASGVINTWGYGGGGAATEVVFGWMNR